MGLQTRPRPSGLVVRMAVLYDLITAGPLAVAQPLEVA